MQTGTFHEKNPPLSALQGEQEIEQANERGAIDQDGSGHLNKKQRKQRKDDVEYMAKIDFLIKRPSPLFKAVACIARVTGSGLNVQVIVGVKPPDMMIFSNDAVNLGRNGNALRAFISKDGAVKNKFDMLSLNGEIIRDDTLLADVYVSFLICISVHEHFIR